MRLTQRGVLPPVNFVELDATLQSSILAPAGAKLVAQADLAATLASSILAPSGAKVVAQADLGATLASSILAPSGAKLIVNADVTDVSAVKINAGTLADARLSTNVPLKNAVNAFTATQNFRGVIPSVLQACIDDVSAATGLELLNISATDMGFRVQNGRGFVVQDDTDVSRFRVHPSDGNVYVRTDGAAALVALRLLSTLRVALLTYNGSTPAIITSTGITSVTRTATGNYTVDTTLAGFAAAPTVVLASASANLIFTMGGNPTATQTLLDLRDNAGATINGIVHMIAIGT